MMANGGEFPYFKDMSLQCEILGFPYKGNASVMYVVMPFYSDTHKLKQLEASLRADHLQQLADSTSYTGAVVLFPKMKIESTIDLKGPLRALGLKSLFDPAQANLALLSPGLNNPHLLVRSPTIQGSPGYSMPTTTSSPRYNVKSSTTPGYTGIQYPQRSRTSRRNESVLIFSRIARIEDPQQNVLQPITSHNNYQRVKIGSRINTGNSVTLDNFRQTINRQSLDNSYQNPGLYADKIIHKVFMDITETGTEAAAATSVSLSRDGNRVTFRVDTPFFFFIRHEETKTILFWGSVNAPTPNY